jgi:hypothetical protein
MLASPRCKALDFFARFGERLLPFRPAFDRGNFHADRCGCLRQLPPARALPGSEGVKLPVREETCAEDALVLAADAVDSAVALHQPHRVPTAYRS